MRLSIKILNQHLSILKDSFDENARDQKEELKETFKIMKEILKLKIEKGQKN